MTTFDLGDVVMVRKSLVGVVVIMGAAACGVFTAETGLNGVPVSELERVGGRLQTGDVVQVLETAGSDHMRGKTGVLVDAPWQDVLDADMRTVFLAEIGLALVLEEDLGRVRRQGNQLAARIAAQILELAGQS